MNIRLLFRLVVVLLTAAWQPLFAATYYVDYDAGSDDNNGISAATPFKHCPGEFTGKGKVEPPGAAEGKGGEDEPAADDQKGEGGSALASSLGDLGAVGKAKGTTLRAGDVVIFKGGVPYRSVLKNSASGQQGSPIVFDGNTDGKFGTGRAVIEGGESIAGWKKCLSAQDAQGNRQWQHLWYTDQVASNADLYSINLCQGEKMMYVAVFPSTDALAVWNDVESAMKPAEMPNTSNKAEHSFADPYFKQTSADTWNGASIGLRAGANRFYMSPVTRFDPQTHRIYYKGISARYYPQLDAHRFTMLNALEVLTKPGQYVVAAKGATKAKRLYCWPWDEISFPGQTTINARSSGVWFENCQQVVLRGFLIQNQAGKPSPGVWGSKADNVTIENNLFRHQRAVMNGRAGAIGMVECKNVVVRKNEMHDTLTIGSLLSKCDGVLFEDNTFDSVLDTTADFYTCRNVQCLRNTVTGRSGLHANGLTFYIDNENVLVEGNHVAHEVPFTMWGAIKVRVVNNVFDGIGRGPGMALWPGKPIQDLLIEHNTIVNATKGDTHQAGIYSGNKGTAWVVRNNILDGASGNIPQQPGILSNNLFLRLGAMPPGQLGNGGIQQPDLKRVFVNAASGDYHLVSGSPAIGRGIAPSIAKDIEGKPRSATRVDLGAYAFRGP